MKNKIRSLGRHLALEAMSLGEAWTRVSRSPKVQFILLHEVKPREETRFEQFLKWLKQNYQIVSYSEAVEKIGDETNQQSVAAISFDDGLKDNLVAARIMSDHGVRGCFFISPSIIGETDSEKINQFCEKRMLFSKPDKFMNWDDIEQLLNDGHEIGNHSQNHLYMMDLNTETFVNEVIEARDELIRRLGEVKHFAWPYGRFFHFHPHWVEQVIQLGHLSCASGERGSHACESIQAGDGLPFCLRRDSLSMSWPLRHITTFLKRSSRNPLPSSQAWAAKS